MLWLAQLKQHYQVRRPLFRCQRTFVFRSAKAATEGVERTGLCRYESQGAS